MVPSYAFSGSNDGYRDPARDRDRDRTCRKSCDKDQPSEVEKVPEINAGGTAIALALLGGLVLVARERKNSKQA